MNPVPVALGVLFLLVAVGDLLWTTLWVEGGAGPLTTRVMAWTWRTIRKLGGRRSRVLTLTGPVTLFLGLAVWIGLLWAGWTLVFARAENALIDTRDTGPISWTERFYFVGYSLFTMGNGDFAPKDGIWQIVTSLTTASGMLFITLIVSYVVSVLDAVTQKRAFASNVSGLGQRGESIVRTAWNGEAFDGLELPLNSFTAEINELTTNHQAYPILHYFYTDQREYAPVLSIVALDEALTLLRFGVSESKRPGNAILENARSSVENYLELVTSSFGHTAMEEPPSPDLDVIREVDVPTVSDETFARSINESADRRRRLLGLVEADARDWPHSEAD